MAKTRHSGPCLGEKRPENGPTTTEFGLARPNLNQGKALVPNRGRINTFSVGGPAAPNRMVLYKSPIQAVHFTWTVMAFNCVVEFSKLPILIIRPRQEDCWFGVYNIPSFIHASARTHSGENSPQATTMRQIKFVYTFCAAHKPASRLTDTVAIVA
jgi:hypothetical protein